MADADPGISNERTALAWQRTALSVVAGSAIVARLTADRLGAATVGPLALCIVLGIWVLVESRGRYASHTGARPRLRPRGGRAPAALAAAVMLIGLTELAALLVG